MYISLPFLCVYIYIVCEYIYLTQSECKHSQHFYQYWYMCIYISPLVIFQPSLIYVNIYFYLSYVYVSLTQRERMLSSFLVYMYLSHTQNDFYLFVDIYIYSTHQIFWYMYTYVSTFHMCIYLFHTQSE